MEIAVILIIILIVIGAISSSNAEAKKLESLKDQYHSLLKGSDKRAALEAGRSYYSALRKGKTLTIYDEQAITNDLSTMS